MRQHESVGVTVLGDLPEVPTLYIGRDADLSSLEDQSADVALSLHLLLETVVQPHLPLIQNKRLSHPFLSDDFQYVLGVQGEVAFKFVGGFFDLRHS